MEFGWLNPIARLTLDTLVGWLRKLDYEAVQKVDYFIANSENTAKRIKKYYNRESEVIYPGVDSFTEWQNNRITEYNKICETVNLWNCKSDYYLGIGRCIPYKKFDLLVDAFNANGKPLILVTNTDNLLYRKLLARSSPNITWRLNISRAERNELYAKARAFLFPPEEDFGLVPIEAMTSGTPVIAYGKWWAVETIVDGETGVFFTPQTPEALNEAIERFEKMRWDREKIRERAEEFSKERFQERILEFIKNHD